MGCGYILHSYNAEMQEPKCLTQEFCNYYLEFLFSPELCAELTECFSQFKIIIKIEGKASKQTHKNKQKTHKQTNNNNNFF